MQPQRFPTERSKVAFLISLLSGRALSWAKAIWNANTSLINSYIAFTNHFKEVFELATGALSVSDQLLRLRQGTSSTHDYTLQFRTLAATCGWNEAALIGVYRQGLDTNIRTRWRYLMTPLDWKASCKKPTDRPTLVCLPYRRNRPPACFTRPRFPSTRTHAGGHNPSLESGTCSSDGNGAVPLLCFG